MNQKAQYFINYNGVKFEIDPEIFAQCSPIFRSYYDPQKTMSINSDLPVEAFEQCLPAVQGKPYQITRDNVSNMRSFANEWNTPDLLKKIDEFDSVHRVISVLENFQNNISKNLSVDDMIPTLAGNLDILIKHPQFARVPQKYMKLILENPNCVINNYHAFFKFIIGYANLQKSPKEKSVLNYIDVSRLDMSEINELFEINIISTQNPKDNTNLPDLLRNLTFYLHDAYQEAAKKTQSEAQRLAQKEMQINNVFHDINNTKKSITALQHKINDKKKKDNQPPQHTPQSRKFNDKPRRDNYQSYPMPNRPPMKIKDMVYTPGGDSNDTSNQSPSDSTH